MAEMIGEVQCSNEDCKKLFDFHHQGMQYANCKYEVTCPECGQVTRFSGTATRRFQGKSLEGIPEAHEVEEA